MYIYNVTSNVHEDVHEKWLEWMRKEHIPEILNTKKFIKAVMTKVLVEEPMGGTTYSVQYTAPNREMLEKYYKEDAPALKKKLRQFGDKVVSFSTELEIIHKQ